MKRLGSSRFPFSRDCSPRSKNIRILNAFLVIIYSVILFLLPITAGLYDFRTDVREDEFTSPTAAGVNCANVTLGKPIYDDDTGTVDPFSDLATDTPAYSASSYNATSRQLTICGLTDNTTRILTIFYDIDALDFGTAVSTLVGYIPLFWLFLVALFPLVAFFAILTGRAD